MQKAFLVSVILVLTAGFAVADMYKWVDDKGTVNFTEDYSKIPKKYRKKVKIKRDDSESASEPAATSGEETKKDQSGKNGAGAKDAAAKSEKKQTYGGKSEEQWKADFRKLNNEINDVQAQIDERKARMADADHDGMSRSRYRGLEMEVKDLEARLAQLRGKLSALDESASRAGVPAEDRY